jgi:hypothetical protein
MNAKHIALTCLLALAASKALADSPAPASGGPRPLTRAEVQAEAIRHPPLSGAAPFFTGNEDVVSTRTREEVRAEGILHPPVYGVEVTVDRDRITPPGLSREQVRAQLHQALASGWRVPCGNTN